MNRLCLNLSWLASVVLVVTCCSSAREPTPAITGDGWSVVSVEEVVSDNSGPDASPDVGSGEVEPCEPECGGKECGPDGCGGVCGECSGGYQCGSTGKCVCLPDCGGKECGANGCGGLCGKCLEGELCLEGKCEPAWECTTIEECFPYVCQVDAGKCAPCTSDAHCAPAGAVCEPLTGLCVECVLDQDCSPFHYCEDNVCVALPPCQIDADCEEGQICDPETGQCFQCAPQCGGKMCGSDGCGGQCGSCQPEELCVEGKCEEPAACTGPEDCTPFVCDPATGKCAKCTEDTQCGEGMVCDTDDGECVECVSGDDCPPLHQCVDKKCEPLPPCAAEEPCPNGMTCDPDSGVCVPCAPQCDGKNCGPDSCGGVCGLCADTEVCSGGVCQVVSDCSKEECFPLICNPELGQCTTCENDDQCGAPWLCDPESGECVACVNDDNCPGNQQCIEHVCEPPPPCQSDEDCPEGKECDQLAGLCVGCTPGCTNKPCGPDGCGGECGECPDGQQCVEWACVCAPDCEGKSCGSDGCGGLCGECGDAGTCSGGVCVAGFFDENSGLVWQNPAAGGLHNQGQAVDHCDGLEWGGSVNWFLPNFEQLKTILSGAAVNGCHWKAGLMGPCGWYWSSTHQPESNNDYYAVNFTDQDVDPTDESEPLYVRCVRYAD